MCGSFGGLTTFCIREWDCEEDDDPADIGPSTLINFVLSTRYHNECRMLVEIEDGVCVSLSRNYSKDKGSDVIVGASATSKDRGLRVSLEGASSW